MPKAPIFRPKDIITGWYSVRWRKAKDANEHHANASNAMETAFRNCVPCSWTTSTRQRALVGHDLYVANTDAIVRILSGWTDKHHRARHQAN